MDLEDRLLNALSLWKPELEAFATTRRAAAQCGDPKLLVLADELIQRVLTQDIEAIVPDDEKLDEEALGCLDRRDEVMRTLARMGYDGQMSTLEGLMILLVSWTAVQAFGRWGGSPWRLLAEVVLDHGQPTYPMMEVPVEDAHLLLSEADVSMLRGKPQPLVKLVPVEIEEID